MIGFHNFIVSDGLKYGICLFIFREVIFFFRFFWAFFDRRVCPNPELGIIWRSYYLNPINPLRIPLLNTIVLLSSGITATISHHRLLNNQRGRIILISTLFLGIYFTSLQIIEYSISRFSISDGRFGTVFFVRTGFHGFHVLVGTIFLFICCIRIIKLRYNIIHHVGFEIALWYWHFVDVVWLFLYVFVYYWRFY